MLKDTKSLGNNKAPACESRGFVHKKRGVHFDTPPCFNGGKLSETYVAFTGQHQQTAIRPYLRSDARAFLICPIQWPTISRRSANPSIRQLANGQAYPASVSS